MKGESGINGTAFMAKIQPPASTTWRRAIRSLIEVYEQNVFELERDDYYEEAQTYRNVIRDLRGLVSG